MLQFQMYVMLQFKIIEIKILALSRKFYKLEVKSEEEKDPVLQKYWFKKNTLTYLQSYTHSTLALRICYSKPVLCVRTLYARKHSSE